MEAISKTKEKVSFKAEVSESLANAVRKYVYEIPVVAIDEVEISRNDSPLYDETLAHRIGLIPLKQEGKKEGSLNLKKKEEGSVYSGDFKGDYDIVYENCPITLLDKGQEVEVIAKTRVGTGSEHSKFLPGLMVYRQVVEISLDKDIVDRVSQIYPEVEVKNKGGKVVIVDDNEREVADFCEGLCEKAGKECEVKSTGELVVYVESFGQMRVDDIFKKSIEVLKKDLEEVSKKIK